MLLLTCTNKIDHWQWKWKKPRIQTTRQQRQALSSSLSLLTKRGKAQNVSVVFFLPSVSTRSKAMPMVGKPSFTSPYLLSFYSLEMELDQLRKCSSGERSLLGTPLAKEAWAFTTGCGSPAVAIEHHLWVGGWDHCGLVGPRWDHSPPGAFFFSPGSGNLPVCLSTSVVHR